MSGLLAVPTPGGHEVIRAAHAAGMPVAIASDASQLAIDDYLQRHDLGLRPRTLTGFGPGRGARLGVRRDLP